MLRRYLTTPQDNSNLTFATVFVLNYTDVAAADPMRTANSSTTGAISALDQQRIVDGLRDVAAVRFVAARKDVVVRNADGCEVVRDNGILILLGPATPAGDKIHVGVNGFAACLGATWFTCVIERRATGWVVTGTTGQAAIS